jgi:hypothetical protein
MHNITRHHPTHYPVVSLDDGQFCHACPPAGEAVGLWEEGEASSTVDGQMRRAYALLMGRCS